MRCSRILLLSCLAAVGCSDQETIQALESEIAALESEITALQRQVELPPDPTPPSDPSAVRQEVTLEPHVYFPSGSAWLPDRGKRSLDLLAEKIASKYPGRKVMVRGHSDSQPIPQYLRATYPSNWELSARRAAAVARYLEREHGIRADHLSVAGAAANSPRDTNTTAEGRRENRRVEIVIVE